MANIKLIQEGKSAGKTREFYKDIKRNFGILANLFKANRKTFQIQKSIDELNIKKKHMKIWIVVLFLFFCFYIDNVFATCPACLGSVGLPLRGTFLTSLTPFDLNGVYQENLEMKDDFWRKIRIFNISVTYNLPESNFSFGATLPFSFAEGFMADRQYHKVTGITGIDLFARYFLFKAPFSSHRPILMAIFGTKLPIGTISHLDHPDVKVPPGLLIGMGGSTIISGPLVFYGNTTYLFNFKNLNHFSLGDKFLSEIGLNTSLNLGRLASMLGIEIQWIYNFSDNDFEEPDVAENTSRQLISIGPKLNVLIIDNPKVSFGTTFRIPVLENRSGTKQLPTTTSLEFNLGIGF